MKKIISIICFFAISFLSRAQTDKVITIEITEPDALTLNVVSQNNPLAFGSTDGAITVQIDGGTAASNGSYTVIWTDSSNTLLTTTTAQVSGSGYSTTLNTIGDGTYTITVFDNAYASANSSNNTGCSIQYSYTLTEPTELLVNITQSSLQEIKCNGGTGSLTANPSGGVSGTSYQYKWYKVNGGTDTLLASTTQTITNLNVGIYKVEVTDDNDISKISSNFNLTEPSTLTFSSSQTDVLCYGGNNGAINVTVSGGAAPYTFEWLDSNTSEDRNNLTAGTYFLKVTDDNGCFVDNYGAGIIITQPLNPITLTTDDIQNVSVNGGNDGIIAISVTGGTVSYTYEWIKDGTSGVYSTNQDINNLTEGVYTVTIKDNNYGSTTSNAGCELVQQYTITAPEVLLVSIIENQEITCFNVSDGALTANGSGGVQIPTISYTYEWFKQNGGSFISIGQTSMIATGLGEGTYKVVITDNNGNQAENTITILHPTQLNVSTTQQNVLCKGGANGSIDITVSGGSPNYSYSWKNSSGSEISTNQDISTLVADTYHIVITDSRNCILEQDIIISEPSDALQITLDSSINPTAFQATDGVINTTVSGGISPYTYQWIDDQSNIVSVSEDISTIGAGSYTLTVKDANFNSTSSNAGCTISETFVLTEPDLLAVTITVNNVISCFGDTNGALQANAIGGISPYTYEWFEVNTNGVSTSLGVLTETITNLDTGLYRVQITDANNISTTTDFNFAEPDVLSVDTIAVTDVLCFNNTTGAIDITITGGTVPYTYFWSNGATTQDISSITSGIYSVVITDVNNCEITQNGIIVSQPTEALSIDNAIITPLTGFETNDGTIEVFISGGTPSYSYSWVEVGTTTVLSTENSVSNLSIGNYQVTITDSNMCQLTQNYQVTQPDELLVDIEQTLFNLCFNDSNATIQANVTGGVQPYSYSWHNLNNSTDILGTTMNFENIMAGSYGVTVTDANGIETSNTITINQPDLLEISNVSQTDVLCHGEQTGALDITVSGGTGAYTYIWNNGATTEDLSGLSSSTYSVTITDENNCSVSETYSITQPNAPLQISNTDITEPLGFGLSDGSISITVQDGTPSYSYAWYDSSNTLLTETSSTLSNIPTGDYSVIITDANNCTVEQQFTVNQPPVLEVTITSIPINCYGETGTLTASASGGLLLNGASYNYQWYDSNNNPLVNTSSLSNILVGSYYVIVTDSNGIEVQANFNLTEPDLLEIISVSKIDVLCYGEQTGVIDITIAGGTGTYTYSWSNGATTEDITGLSSGNYTITITDENNCSVSDTYIITQPVLYDISSVSLMRPTGSNADGSISVEVTGGEAPFTYQWFNSLGALVQETVNSTLNTNVLTNVEPETYTIIITDTTGCIHQDTYNLANPGELITDIEQIQVISCNGGNDGQLMANSIGGSGGNQYTWYDAGTNTVIGTDNEVLSNIPSGSYYVVVSNADGLQEQSSVLTVTEPDAVQVTSISQNVSCYQENDGAIVLQATGGTEVFEYRIRLNSGLYSNWFAFTNDSITIENLISGDYVLQVRDSNQCNFEINGATQTMAITITQPDLLEITSSTINAVTGFGLSNGSIELNINGGTMPYTIVWTDSNNVTQPSTNEIVSNIPAGTYTVNITDAQGCTTTGIYTVTEPDLLEVTVDTQNIILCNGYQNGSLIASVIGGVPFTSGNSYLYNWFEEGNVTAIGTNVILENLGLGNYYVIVEDQNGNTVQSDMFTLTQPETLTAILEGGYINCGTENDWTISTQVLGGTQPYSYSWNTGDNTSDIINVQPGNYLVIITDAFGCEIIETYNVDVPEVLNVDANITQVNCADACEGIIDLNITGGVAPYIINWDTGDTTNSINNLCPGEYMVSVVDQQECEIVLNLTIENPEVITFNLGEDRTLCNGQFHELDISIDDLSATYGWTSTNGFTSSSSNVSLSDAGIYTATITTSLGCVGTDSIEIFQSQTGINSQFLITTQAFAEENIILVNTSNPLSENVQWFIPNEAEIIQQNNETITLQFDIPGAYEITLRSFQGNCFQDYTKPIIVGEVRDLPDIGDADAPFIVDFVTYPNPATGVFEVDITLQEEATVSLRLFSLVSNAPIDDRQAHNASEYNLDYNVNLTTGIYFLLLETAKGSEIRKIIIE